MAIPERTLPVKVLYQPREQGDEPKAEKAAEPTASTAPEVADPSPGSQNSEGSAQKEGGKRLAETESLNRLESALVFLHDQGQFNIIVLGSGLGAIRAQNFMTQITPKIENPRLRANFEKPVRALIIINGRNQLPSEKDLYRDWFTDPEIPILDIFVMNDSRNIVEAKARKVLAKQKGVLVYKQVKVPAVLRESSWGETPISRRVRSFLDTNAVGVEVKNARVKN